MLEFNLTCELVRGVFLTRHSCWVPWLSTRGDVPGWMLNVVRDFSSYQLAHTAVHALPQMLTPNDQNTIPKQILYQHKGECEY